MAGIGHGDGAAAIEQLTARLRERLPAPDGDLVAGLARLYYRDVAAEDLAERDPLDLYGAVLDLYRFAAVRERGQSLVRIYNPDLERHGWQSRHTIVEIVADDMPFLVDSAVMELNRRGLGVHLIVHPVVAVQRGPAGRLTAVGPSQRDVPAPDGGAEESFMHIEVDRQSDALLLTALEGDLTRVLGDVRLAVEDWRPMQAAMRDAIAGLGGAAGHLPAAELAETRAFIDWLVSGNFTLLGACVYDTIDDAAGTQLVRVPGSAQGILRESAREGLPSRSFSALPAAVRAKAHDALPPMVVVKAHKKSTVHRATYLDYVSVKRYAADGTVTGESRFVGLFTSAAYTLPPREIPLLRRKIEEVTRRAALPEGGHAAKALANILDTFPRDELLQTDDDTLFATATAVLQLQDRHRIRLFVRKGLLERFVSCLVYIPRDRFNTVLREKIEGILKEAFAGTEVEYQVQISESVLARVLFLVRTPKGLPDPVDTAQLEQKIVAAAQSWGDQLQAALVEAHGEEQGHRFYRLYGKAFPASYQESVPARAAVPDIAHIEALGGDASDRLEMSLYHRLEDEAGVLRLKLIRRDRAVHLSDALPVLENMGLRVLFEEPHVVRDAGGHVYSMHDFGMTPTGGVTVEVERVRAIFQEAFAAIWSGVAENDGFNRLVLAAGLAASQITVLRAYCKYLLQIGIPFSQSYIEATLTSNAALSADLVALFEARFDPARDAGRADRVAEVEARIASGLETVQILDEDRIIRRFRAMIRATLRTNAWQKDPAGKAKPYLSLKVDPTRAPDMPKPVPAFEVFVYSPSVEAVHLRGGKVARGGIRWSDRREDFRTEVLGLMKAQTVKNSVIVPVGAKGGFYVKRPPVTTDRAAIQAEAIRCYTLFLSGLLDLTDNRVAGAIRHPVDVVRYDEDDPYLVVAADKGTATFSDIANGVSRDYGFWLDDAFASGGSAGYDHKGMGITARGAWESVKRHCRELGKDPAVDSLTVTGVGDMSGDVFGNGMLLSDKLKLVAAFDHRHFFIDPDPDPAASFAERQRLFALPRSSWADYDEKLISTGGGVFPRSAKSIPLSPEARRVLGIEAAALAPADLMSAILKAPVDLFWNGGIGTYVKAASETHRDAQDRGNDASRVDGGELRCAIVAEGGNLGLTQRGRIEYALGGGRLNTDFIDNSAGVDCSDHEVNIKILLGEIVAAGDLTLKQRDVLLAEMTDEIAVLVLRDNILQNLALSLSQSLGTGLLDAQTALMRRLEQAGRLDRGLEFLPGDDVLAERRKSGRGLTRPETAVLLAYAKMTLYADLLETDIPDDPYFAGDLLKYFPRPLRRRFPGQIERHGLRRELVATWIANSIVNRGLEIFTSELCDETGASVADVVRAAVVARDALGLIPLWGEIESLGVTAQRQLALLASAQRVLMQGTRWFLAHGTRHQPIAARVASFAPGLATIGAALADVLTPGQRAEYETARDLLAAEGIEPQATARLAGLPMLVPGCDIVSVSEATGRPLLQTAGIYCALADHLDVTRLRRRLGAVPMAGRWERLAVAGLEDDLTAHLRRLATVIATNSGDVAAWLSGNRAWLDRYDALTAQIGEGAPDLAMLTVVVRALGSAG